MLNIHYQIAISVLTLLKLKIKVSKVTKKEEPLNLNLAEPSEVKSLAFPFTLH